MIYCDKLLSYVYIPIKICLKYFFRLIDPKKLEFLGPPLAGDRRKNSVAKPSEAKCILKNLEKKENGENKPY